MNARVPNLHFKVQSCCDFTGNFRKNPVVREKVYVYFQNKVYYHQKILQICDMYQTTSGQNLEISVGHSVVQLAHSKTRAVWNVEYAETL